ncbi:MAG TPA: pyruvate kinase [Candidatus Saccharibacteria bacterium]|jgi:pyruvate kinase|nr:pyruvate kinase [Candidatus Saccharibacteria bacterium]HMT55332.1 pyruvate kinase [Candidatus Saccharibacteria bacterium]
MKDQTIETSVHSSSYKRTKIIATIGPVSNTYETIRSLIKGGANGLRLNCSHGTNEERAKHVKLIRKASKELGKPVTIILDLQGPKIRLGDFDGVVPVEAGQHIRLGYKTDWDRSGVLPVQYDLSKKVKRGESLLLFDGRIRSTVTSVKDGIVHIQIENDGVLIARKGINLPDTDFGGDVITKKDLEDLAFGSTADIDVVAMSFVQTSRDIEQLRRKMSNLNFSAKIMAKIETKSAITHMASIVEASDMLMVARGDLAPEVSLESVPVHQRRIVELGLQHAKPVVVATQVLASMVDSPEPTRAEVNDVASAVLMGADCVMLSEETAVGKHALKAVQTMKKVILFTEHHSSHLPLADTVHHEKSRQSAICETVIHLSEKLSATAIVAETKSGATALQIASRRPKMPIIAVTSDNRVAQQLAIVYGIKSYVRPDSKLAAAKLTNWLKLNRVLDAGDTIVSASGQYPGVVGTTDTIKVRVLS